jgi:predicted kinase
MAMLTDGYGIDTDNDDTVKTARKIAQEADALHATVTALERQHEAFEDLTDTTSTKTKNSLRSSSSPRTKPPI